jgi:hypothetical protein
MKDARAFFTALNHEYAAVHKAKEDLFWATYMGISDDHAGFARAENAYKDFISDPGKLAATREQIARVTGQPAGPQRDTLLHGLNGWRALFEAHVIETEEGRRLMHDIVQAEAELFAKNRTHAPEHINERGEAEVATLGTLATNLTTNPVEERRRSSFDAMRGIEQWVLANGLLEIVALRNRFARAAGYDDYFTLKVHKTEQMTRSHLMGILDEFLARTHAANGRTLRDLRERHGEAASLPWNLRFLTIGGTVRQIDEYMPFGPALRRWVQSFRRLGIGFKGATLQLDLLERAGKYQNGFCHGPVPAWVDEDGRWVPGQINFTSDAKPDQVGSGVRAITTLFHEGGHAAHFANVVQNSPCFSQEYAPTSMAYAETQSMFCDSLLDDGDWMKSYARNAAGEAIPDELIRARVASTQPMRAFDRRSLAAVPYFESALYAMSDEARTPAAVLSLARETERRVLGMESPRPMLAIPHLLNQESAASYQGYLLAEMAVHQTRAFFLRRDGFLTDNGDIGPMLAAQYWAPGNSVPLDTMLQRLTGEGFSARYLADACNQSVDEAWALAQQSISGAAGRTAPALPEVPSLGAHIRVVHGSEVLADSSEGEDTMCTRFEAWVNDHFQADRR